MHFFIIVIFFFLTTVLNALPSSRIHSSTLFLISNPTSTSCYTVSFLVSATASNKNLLGPIPVPSDSSLLAYITQDSGTIQTSRNFNISGTYCTPSVQHPIHTAPLMLFVHGVSYDRRYFAGLRDEPVGGRTGDADVENSWVDYATKRGYYTLAIDRIGSGQSEIADPVLEVQAPLQAALITTLIQQHLTPLFSPIIFTSHSYGSILATHIAASNPTLLSAFILTGIALPLPTDSFIPPLLFAGIVPAAVYSPIRFPIVPYTPGYLFLSLPGPRRDLLYSNDTSTYDPTVPPRDFSVSNAIALGELATLTFINASAYRGPVFVGAGRQDAVFCGNGTSAMSDCERSGKPDQLDDFAREYFGNARNVKTVVQQGSGHCVLLHKGWRDIVGEAHAWLEEVGL